MNEQLPGTMGETNPTGANGRVASLHLHPRQAGAFLGTVDSIEAVAAQGIHGDGRYFARLSRSTGKPSRRQVSLIEREQIAKHATALGLENIAPGVVRSNIETSGIDLVDLIGCQVKVGEAVLFFYEGRVPCERMDAICQGLRGLMENNRQGVMAEVLKSGAIRVGDAINVIENLR